MTTSVTPMVKSIPLSSERGRKLAKTLGYVKDGIAIALALYDLSQGGTACLNLLKDRMREQ